VQRTSFLGGLPPPPPQEIVFTEICIKLNIATELKTNWSIDDRLKISERKVRKGPPLPRPSKSTPGFT